MLKAKSREGPVEGTMAEWNAVATTVQRAGFSTKVKSPSPNDQVLIAFHSPPRNGGNRTASLPIREDRRPMGTSCSGVLSPQCGSRNENCELAGFSRMFGCRTRQISLRSRLRGGEGGIRTLGTGVSPYNGLANRRLQPLGHLSGVTPSLAFLQPQQFIVILRQ